MGATGTSTPFTGFGAPTGSTFGTNSAFRPPASNFGTTTSSSFGTNPGTSTGLFGATAQPTTGGLFGAQQVNWLKLNNQRDRSYQRRSNLLCKSLFWILQFF